MKFLVILFSFVVFASAIEQAKHKLTEENLQRLKKANDACAAQQNADPNMMDKVASGAIERTETNKKYLLCFFDKLELVDTTTGKANVDKIASYLGNNPLVEQFKEAMKKCNEAVKGTPIDTLLGIYSCYFETSPVLFAL